MSEMVVMQQYVHLDVMQNMSRMIIMQHMSGMVTKCIKTI